MILFFFIGVFTNVIESIFIFLINIFLKFYINDFKNCFYFDPSINSNVPCLQDSMGISGAGASGSIIGIYTIILLMFLYFSLIYVKRKKISWNLILNFYTIIISFYIILSIYSILERILADFATLFYYLDPLVNLGLETDLFNNSISLLSDILITWQNSQGNPNLAHVFGILSGFLIFYIYYKKRKFVIQLE
ncbi:MAG: hypothetical protein HeimC3_22430 [Candidatus Heimdallarchaeota archaeon LC_3]|nr:MAG: hypothetical protein HeimC3_22430 [Candidatus Heimdallarchaeota archaeon LC_3]